jgi:hypothetical protein
MIEKKAKFSNYQIVNHRGRKAKVIEVIPLQFRTQYVIEYYDSQEKISYVNEEDIKLWEEGVIADVVCKHPDKYFNVLSANLKYWVCPDCKKDLGEKG